MWILLTPLANHDTLVTRLFKNGVEAVVYVWSNMSNIIIITIVNISSPFSPVLEWQHFNWKLHLFAGGHFNTLLIMLMSCFIQTYSVRGPLKLKYFWRMQLCFKILRCEVNYNMKCSWMWNQSWEVKTCLVGY